MASINGVEAARADNLGEMRLFIIEKDGVATHYHRKKKREKYWAQLLRRRRIWRIFAGKI